LSWVFATNERKKERNQERKIERNGYSPPKKERKNVEKKNGRKKIRTKSVASLVVFAPDLVEPS